MGDNSSKIERVILELIIRISVLILTLYVYILLCSFAGVESNSNEGGYISTNHIHSDSMEYFSTRTQHSTDSSTGINVEGVSGQTGILYKYDGQGSTGKAKEFNVKGIPGHTGPPPKCNGAAVGNRASHKLKLAGIPEIKGHIAGLNLSKVKGRTGASSDFNIQGSPGHTAFHIKDTHEGQ